MPVALFVRVTFTPGTTAPVGSVTVPVTPPVSTCARRHPGKNTATANQSANTMVLFQRRLWFIRRPPDFLLEGETGPIDAGRDLSQRTADPMTQRHELTVALTKYAREQ